MKHLPQPPVQPALRATEAHEFWPGFIIGIVGFILLLTGAQHVTGVPTIQESSASEAQLVKAFSSGGLQYASRLAPPPPPRLGSGDPSAAADALEQWQRQRANTPAPTWKVRVDVGASTPCPT